MAPHNIESLANSVKSGSAKDREKAVDELGSLLSLLNRTPSLAELKDHSYHNIFESIFGFALQEKAQFYKNKTAAAGRLVKCATAVRNAATRGATRLKQKTLLAAIDHITQVLPGPNGDYVAPLLQDYVKALAELLSRPAHVELLARNDAAGWTACADLLVDLALYVMPQDDHGTPASRNSPVPGNNLSLRSTGRSSSSSQSQRRNGYGDGGILRDVLDGLHHLTSGTNAPLRTRFKDIIRVMLRILRVKHLSLGSIQTLCFAILNAVFSVIQAEEMTEAKALVSDMIPLMTYWWRAEKVSQDELIRALRNEISRSLFLMRQHLEHLACGSSDSRTRNEVVELAEVLWLEYSKRSEAFRLQFTDITFDLPALAENHLRNPLFGLRPHNLEGESQWALVQNLASLESILLKSRSRAIHQSVEADEQPRKRRRTQDDSIRLRSKLRVKELGIRRTALQLIPFIVPTQALTADEASGLLLNLASLISDKDTVTAAWALVACATCVSIPELRQDSLEVWRQIWHLTVRSISLPGTSRAACALLYSLLRADFLPYHEISEELDIMVTAADISGPATLSDTSLSLMTELFHIRSIRLPSTSQTTCHHIIRWIFLKWNPSDASYASFHSANVPALGLVNLLRTCCGMQSLCLGPAPTVSGGSLSEAWNLQREQSQFNSYLLLLDNHQSSWAGSQSSHGHQIPPTVDPSSFYASKKLILELFAPKVEDLSELCTAWTKKSSEGGIQISLDRFQSVLCAVIIGALLLPQIEDLNTAQSSTIEASLMSVADRSFSVASTSVEPQSFNDLSLRVIRPFIPETTTASLGDVRKKHSGLLGLQSRFYDSVLKQQMGAQSSYGDTDMMDIDQEFDSQASRSSSASAVAAIPRQNSQLRLNPRAFYVETRMRLNLMRIVHEDEGQVGLVPDAFIDDLLDLDDNDFLACQGLLVEIFRSDLVVSPENAGHIIERLGMFVSRFEYQSCEVAITTCLDVIDGLHQTWLQDTQDLSDAVGDLYNHMVKVCLPKNGLSPRAQISLSRLLLTLMRTDPDYGTKQGMNSCRTTLLFILKDSAIPVKCYIGDRIAGIFELYILKLHDEVFVDVLDSLPSDPHDLAGIAFRLLALSKLACRWSTLLRRCTYHIFETPGKIGHSLEYATRCLADISTTLKLPSPKELFSLFSRQLLYTWLESDTVEDIPYSIFGFTDLADLLRSAQAEATGFMIMRGQEAECADLARRIGVSEVELIKTNFATATAYSMIYGDSSSSGEPSSAGEDFIQKKLGQKALSEARFANFADIVSAFFDLIDQDSPIEKAFMKQRDLTHAGNIMKMMKDFSHSPAQLPPNQQPIFKARFLIIEIRRLCEGTVFDFRDMWSPSIVVFITRKLLDTVKRALGSLHACSVLRKIRILICFAGKVALESYALEMLLNALRTFIVNAECADDALGVSQYLLTEGSQYLTQAPSFLAGYALSTLASLRVFLESSQASTTQESQFKATMSKAQKFHEWFTGYLDTYSSPVFKSENQAKAFKSITNSAAHIRSSGNAEKGTAESKLLLDILHDSTSKDQLLDEPSRRLALGLLCNDFTIPVHCLDDVINSDELAVEYASEVWKSCKNLHLSQSYLSWAGRVVGRAFAASGVIPDDVLRETRLDQYQKIAPDSNGSEMGLLSLLQDLTSDPDSVTAGLAEAALRKAVSQAVFQEDEPLIYACRRSLRESLFSTSQWNEYRSPPSENIDIALPNAGHAVWSDDVASHTWLAHLSVHLAQSVPQSIILSVLPSILFKVKGFAEQAFPFVVHLVLLFQLEQQQTVKRSLSGALKGWLSSTDPASKDNLKLLLNTLLYLRTQEYPKETSIADRANWLEIDYAQASSAASSCGMYKSALLFVELLSPEAGRSSRRSSAVREGDMNETLLSIFENLDDPDAYYGLPEEASLSSILARAEYENEGTKSLAFRGAQYDSNLRLRRNAAESDAQAMVKALNTLGLSGLSHSLLQTQQSIGAATSSLESTFSTARRLETWHLPAPVASDHHSVTVYKSLQSMHQATDASVVRANVYDGFQKLTESLTGQGLNATSLRKKLGALASLSELDVLMNVADSAELNGLLDVFKSRGEWMNSGLYDDVSQILSCRGTSLSMLSQHTALLRSPNLDVTALRQMEVRSMLLSSGIHRYHQATQESLNISTALTHLIPVCDQLGLVVDASVKIEVANSLWDHGEMSSSIRMLQGIDKESALKRQTIPVNRSDLLSKIGHQVSVARLEKPQDIQKKYLEPALKELKSNTDEKAAGSVYHQFAMFCDGQLQDPAGLEDLARLQSLKKGKSDEVAELQSLISSTRDTQLRTRYSHVLSKEKQWLNLDEQELRRVEQTRSEFVRLSLENYLLSLMVSDEHNNDALRFTALWLERSAEDATNKAVAKHLGHVPTRKFAGLMNQLSSRLQNLDTPFQKLLLDLVTNICTDHPYHGMYQIWSGTKAKVQQKDDVQVQRVKATERVAQRLATSKHVGDVWLAIDKTSKYYHLLAMDSNKAKYKSGAKIQLKDVAAGHNLVNCLAKYRVPPPTMTVELSATKDYSDVPTISKLEPGMTIASGVSAPKIITAVGSNGVRYKQLVKGGHDDLRQDAIMEQVFAAVSSLLKLHRSTQQRNLGIRTYKVLPLTASSGLIEFVPNTIPLHEFLMPAHERYYPKDLKGSQCRKEIFNVQSKTVEARVAMYRKVTDKFHPVMRYFFMENFVDPDEWFVKRLAYTRSTAAISMLGHVLGVGDRHGHNILLDHKTGEVVHIDLGVAFEAGRILPVPELVPFRLTRDIVDGMGITKTEGIFRRCCEFTLDALREEQYSIMTILDVLRYDPLYSWSISPLRLAKLQKARDTAADDGADDDAEQSEAEMKNKSKSGKRGGDELNEPSEADRALEVVRKKLSKSLSVTATVNDLINQAVDESNLAVLYSGWAAYA